MTSTSELAAAKSSRQSWLPLMELATKEVFELMLGAELKSDRSSDTSTFDITAMVGLAGHVCGMFTLRCSKQAAARMAEKMLGSRPAIDSQETKDAFGEVSNMVAGNFKNKLTGMGDKCMISVPTVITGSDYSVYSLADSDVLEVRQLFEGLPFVITLQITLG